MKIKNIIQKITSYVSKNRKEIYKNFFVLLLILFIATIFYADFRMAQNMIFSAMGNEKESHAKKVCLAMNKIDSQADFFLDKINGMRNSNNYLSKGQKKEIIRELRVIEGNIKNEEISHFEFYNNDFSIRFFSKNNNAEIDKLFSQITSLPIYGYRAVDSMEELLKSNRPSISQLDVSEIEFSILKERINSIKNKTSACQ